MKNTHENKAKFFALYYGQKVKSSCLPEQKEPTTINHETFHIFHLVINGILLLKPISKLTDEDAIELSKTWGSEVPSKILGNIIAMRISTKSGNEVRNAIGAIDFLRSKGYALPWMGCSVDDLVSFGWIKLIK